MTTIRIATGDGDCEIEAERVEGCWALHRAYKPDGEVVDLWSVTWTVSGHELGYGCAAERPREVAEAIFAMVCERWPHWPRRHPEEKLTPAKKLAARRALGVDYQSVLSRFAEVGRHG